MTYWQLIYRTSGWLFSIAVWLLTRGQWGWISSTSSWHLKSFCNFACSGLPLCCFLLDSSANRAAKDEKHMASIGVECHIPSNWENPKNSTDPQKGNMQNSGILKSGVTYFLWVTRHRGEISGHVSSAGLCRASDLQLNMAHLLCWLT